MIKRKRGNTDYEYWCLFQGFVPAEIVKSSPQNTLVHKRKRSLYTPVMDPIRSKLITSHSEGQKSKTVSQNSNVPHICS